MGVSGIYSGPTGIIALDSIEFGKVSGIDRRSKLERSRERGAFLSMTYA